MTDNVKNTVDKQRRFFESGKPRDVPFRTAQLKKLKNLLKKRETDIFEAVSRDFKKPAFETFGTELGVLYAEIDHVIKHLPQWAKAEKVRGSLINFPSRNYIYPEPYGVVLVIGTWNYPIQLSLAPALGAIAAGNCTIIKPSELASNSSRLIADIINDSFDSEFLTVVEGDADTTQSLLEQSLDYVFFTGSTRVGKIVMKSAAEHLTPVTLELGGKSPAIVDQTADLKVAARRIAWGKYMNAGQTCVAPDYVYVHKLAKEQFVGRLCREIENFYGDDPQQSGDYARIINRDHFDRLSSYLNDESRVITGGRTDPGDLFIEPTVLADITWDHPCMQDEIFGPLLPVLEYEDLDSVITILNDKPRPLAFYLFSSDKETQQKIVSKLSFGGGCINDTLTHLGNPRLPFGGIGKSGMGNYHGKKSFDTFSHRKSILKKPIWPDFSLRYPPYKSNLKWLKKIFN